MSDFRVKLQNRQLPNAADWEDHLIQAHRIRPRMTPEVFGLYLDSSKRNTYQVLAEAMSHTPRADTILDLACGDGHLIPTLMSSLPGFKEIIGLDLSEDSIQAARVSVRDSRVKFLVGRAQQIPLSDLYVDHVFCHLALMLISPLKPALQEVERVLKPDGFVSCLIPGGKSQGLHQKLSRLASLFIQSYLPRASEARASDPLLQALRESDPRCESYQFKQRISFDGLWAYLKGMYLIDALPDEGQRELADEVRALALEHREADALITLEIPMQRFSLSKAQLEFVK